MDSALGVRETWRGVLAALGVADDASIIIGGSSAPYIARSAPLPVADESAHVAFLGRGGELGVDARPDATGVDPASVDAALMLGTWGDVAYLRRVARECHRILRPGGVALVGRFDAERLSASSTARYRSAMLGGPVDRGGSVGGAMIELALVRARLRNLATIDLDLPIATLDDVDTYLEAVRNGLWPGVEALGDDGIAELMRAVRRSLADEALPIVEYQPWRFVRGVRPT